MKPDQLYNTKVALVERVISSPGVVSVLHAPAGFGKTTLLQQIRQSLLDKGAAVSDRLEIGNANEAVPWFLLDDSEIFDIHAGELRRTLSAPLSQAGVVIAARHIEALPIARLRAEGRVLCFGPRQICMSTKDAALVLRRVLNKRSADWLGELADGWNVAIGLLQSYAREPGAHFGPDGDFVSASGLSAYIDQEILADIPSDWQRTLLFSSVLDTCDAATLDFMLPNADLGRNLGFLREHLPGLVDDSEGTTKINPLLKLHLSRKFERLSREERAEALERAAQRCIRLGRTPEAAGLVARAGSSKAIVDFVRKSEGLRLCLTGGIEVIREIVTQAEGSGIDDEPRLKLLKCFLHLKSGEVEEGERLFQEVVVLLSDDEPAQRDAAVVNASIMIYGCRPISDADLESVRKSVLRNNKDPAWHALVLAIQSILEIQRGNMDAAVAVIGEAVRHARAEGLDYELLFHKIHGANIALARGNIPDARGLLGQARKTWRQKFSGDSGVGTILDALMANLEFEAGRLSSARLHARRSTQRMPHVEAWLDIYMAAYEPMHRLLVADVGLAAALVHLRRQQEALSTVGLTRIAQLLKALEVCLRGEALLRNEREDDLGDIVKFGEPACWQERELFCMAEAYIALSKGRHVQAAEILSALIGLSESQGIQRSVLRAKLLLVTALELQGEEKKAEDTFVHALALGVKTGLSRIFAEVGGNAVDHRCRRWFAAVEAGGIDPPELKQLLRTIARWQTKMPIDHEATFTPREMDVLRALDQGGGDKVIGRRLGISDHAVRYHLKNIYRKLKVGDRVGALARVRNAGLLS